MQLIHGPNSALLPSQSACKVWCADLSHLVLSVRSGGISPQISSLDIRFILNYHSCGPRPQGHWQLGATMRFQTFRCQLFLGNSGKCYRSRIGKHSGTRRKHSWKSTRKGTSVWSLLQLWSHRRRHCCHTYVTCHLCLSHPYTLSPLIARPQCILVQFPYGWPAALPWMLQEPKLQLARQNERPQEKQRSSRQAGLQIHGWAEAKHSRPRSVCQSRSAVTRFPPASSPAASPLEATRSPLALNDCCAAGGTGCIRRPVTISSRLGMAVHTAAATLANRQPFARSCYLKKLRGKHQIALQFPEQ